MAVEVRQLVDDQLEERVGGAQLQAMDRVYIDDDEGGQAVNRTR